MKTFAYISIIIILGGLTVLLVFLKTPQRQPGCGVVDYEPFCGTESLSEASVKGKQIFNANCAACHKLDKDMTGPSLRNIGKTYDTLVIAKFLHGEKTIIKSKGYTSTCINFPQLTTEDISNLINYTD